MTEHVNPGPEVSSLHTQLAPLDQIDVAPENLRAGEPADAELPELADTIEAAGLLYPLLVRPGRKGEAAFMALDGRRRLLALRSLVEQGRTDADRPVRIEVAISKGAQAAAIVISNTQRAPVHVADVIVAVGKLKSLKLSTAKIAAALGYPEIEVKRLQRLAGLPKPALEALKAGRITLRTAKLLARVTDADVLKQFAQNAASGYLSEHSIAQHLNGRPGLDDPMFDLIGVERYRAAGGRIDADLFGEFDDVVLDPDKLQVLWTERAAPLVEAAKARGLTVYFQGGELYRGPDGLETAGPNAPAALSQDARLAWDLACGRTDDLAQSLCEGERHPQSRAADLVAFLIARLDQEAALHGADRICAVGLYPEAGTGFEAQVYLQPRPEAPAEDEGDGDVQEGAESPVRPVGSSYRPEIVVPAQEIDLSGRSHGLHETYTDVATRGLIRSVADDPMAALTITVARLFVILALQGGSSFEQSATTLQGRCYSRGGMAPDPALDGVVRDRLEARRRAYLNSGLRPIPCQSHARAGGRPHLRGMPRLHPLDRATGLAPLAPADEPPAGEVALLLHLDDLRPETLELGSARVARVGALVAHAEGASDRVRAADDEAMADALARAGAHFGCEAGTAVPGWSEGLPVVAGWAPVGPSADALPSCRRVRREWDERSWPRSTRGYFQLRSAIPQLLELTTEARRAP